MRLNNFSAKFNNGDQHDYNVFDFRGNQEDECLIICQQLDGNKTSAGEVVSITDGNGGQIKICGDAEVSNAITEEVSRQWDGKPAKLRFMIIPLNSDCMGWVQHGYHSNTTEV